MKLALQMVAGALDLPVSTLKRWIRQGRIPIQRSGDDAVFTRSAVERWAAAHNLPFCLDGDDTVSRPAPLGTLADAMRRGRVLYRLPGSDATTFLASAVDGINALGSRRRRELLEELIARERLGSTGIGNGIAIPHPRDPLSTPPDEAIIATCFPATPVDFNAIDDRPVFVFFILINPTVKHHLHMLSRLSYCIRDSRFRDFLATRPDLDALCAQAADLERQLEDS
jgi:PTS system nitrogen regulatory IIA component